MSRSLFTTALLCAVAIAPAAMAQQPQPPMPHDSIHAGMDHEGMMRRMGPGAPRMPMRMGAGLRMRMAPPKGGIAGMLLGQTAELKLSDAQVTRLAALARSADAQQEAMRTEMETLHRNMMEGPRTPGVPPKMPADMEARMKSAHDQMHANMRDALAVLTPDQLATAWEHRGMGRMRR